MRLSTSMLIGIDDTDSPRGMCTTYLGTILKKTLEQELGDSIELRLIRLNPTIKFKTRGNAAICISIEHSYDVLDIVSKHIEQMAHLDDEATHPGAVILDNEIVPSDIPVSYTHLRAHETPEHIVCRLPLVNKKNNL